MSALERFNEFVKPDDAPMSPLERLRAFCSFAMSGDDWLDVEPFFAAVEAERAWQPIETAPKDGTMFLAARFVEDEEPDYEIGAYEPLKWERYVPANVQGLYRREEETLHEWRGFNNFHRMTHWCPLPAPPEAA